VIQVNVLTCSKCKDIKYLSDLTRIQLQAPITYTYAHSHIKAKSQKWTLKFVTETYALTMVKPFQFLSNFTNHPLFISLIGCQSRKPQTKAERKTRFGEQSPARVSAWVGSRGHPRGRAGASSCAAQTQKRGFSPQNLKSDHFQPKSCLYNFPTPSITSYNINFTRLMTLIIKHPNNPFDIQMHKLASYIDSNRCIASLTIQ
jgi:hypothetical protein